MIKKCISKNWIFKPSQNEYQNIDLPHDYAISNLRKKDAPGGPSTGFFHGGQGSYIKYITPENENSHYILDIDGAYMCAEIAINNYQAAVHPHGYTPFILDLTNKLRFGRTNKIRITTDDMQHSTRWYSGAGLYRDVFLWEGGKIRTEPRDIFITTKEISEESALIEIAYTITADIDANVKINSRVKIGSSFVARNITELSVNSNKKTTFHIELKIENPALWDTENPNLYTLFTEISDEKTVLDTAETTFGIRTISADVKNGLLLNGKPLKLRGGCIHHDHGVLGAAAFPEAEKRKISRLKAAGFNAIRIAHNPPSLALLEVCDRLGMIVMDEAFDMWNMPKAPHDYHLWFSDWCLRDISYMVLRDRNHPCVISYSIGNEILERDGSSDGAIWSKKLSDEIKKFDSTRLVTSGICGLWGYDDCESTDPEDYREDCLKKYDTTADDVFDASWAKLTEEYAKPLDIVGYNYLYHRYETDHELYPERIIWGSETHAIHFYDSWAAVMKNSHVLGDFTWTAYDNLGEAGTGRSCWARDGVITGISLADYPWRSCYQGDLDLCGYRRPQSYFREAIWLGNTEPKIFVTHPEHFGEEFSGTEWHWYDVTDSWSFDDKYIGHNVKAEVYTDTDKIVWYLNDKKIGESKPEKAIASINTIYEKGTITAVAYKHDKECGRSSLSSVGKAVSVTVVPEKNEFSADNRDLCYFDITITDQNKNRVPDAKNKLKCIVSGGELLGIFSADPKNEDHYTENTCHAFEGRALAIVRSNNTGRVNLTVYSDSLASGSATVSAK